MKCSIRNRAVLGLKPGLKSCFFFELAMLCQTVYTPEIIFTLSFVDKMPFDLLYFKAK